MNAIIAVEDLIKTNKRRIKTLKEQLSDHDSGKVKISRMAYASTENALEQSQKALEKHETIYEELKRKGQQEVEKEERIKAAIKRKNYYKYQKLRIKRNSNIDNIQKLEAMRVIDELPPDFDLEDEDLFDIAHTTIQLDIRVHDELEEELRDIKRDFHELLLSVKDEDIKQLGMLQSYIPILALHLSIFVEELNSTTEFKGLPKFQDWWINELWINHQAYFGLYKWRDIVTSLCGTNEQKEAWEIIFSNWIFIKKLLNKKGKLAFDFNLAFDRIMEQYAGLEEELLEENINSMDAIIQNITKKEDFQKFKSGHKTKTDYYEYKIQRV
jgi:hypothetical protein